MIAFSSPTFFGRKDIKGVFYALLRRWQADLAGKNVLDLPAGYGDTAHFLTGLGARITGADRYPEFSVTRLLARRLIGNAEVADSAQFLPEYVEI